MKTVVIGSKNPVKIEVAKQAFAALFPNEEFTFNGVSAESGVPDQPMGDAQTLLGAQNRLAFIKVAHPEGDYYVAQEGGLMDEESGMSGRAYILVADKEANMGTGITATYLLPPKVAALVRTGLELGDAIDHVFSLSNSKQGNGAVGALTDNTITRTSFYLQAAIIALAQIKHKEWY